MKHMARYLLPDEEKPETPSWTFHYVNIEITHFPPKPTGQNQSRDTTIKWSHMPEMKELDVQ